MDITGTLEVKFDEEVISDKFKKRDFVLTIDPNGQYSQHVQFQLSNDKCSLIEKFAIGDELRVYFNLLGRAWRKDDVTKYFNTLSAWKVELVKEAKHGTPQDSIFDNDSTGDLPF